jgi:hypothetical protein
MSNNRNSFIFYRSFFEAIKELPKDQKAEIYDAICSYALDEKAQELSGISKSFFALIKPQLDANRKRFNNGCQKKQNRSKNEAKDKQNRSKNEANNNVNDNVECINEELEINNLNSNLNLNPNTELENKERKDYTLKSLNPKERKPDGFPSHTFAKDFKTLSEEHQKLSLEKYKAIRKEGITHEQIVEWLQNFDDFWKHYTPITTNQGKCVGKGDKIGCRIKYLRILYKQESHDQIMQGLKRYLEFCHSSDQLTLAASTFLNREQWKQTYNDSVKAKNQQVVRDTKIPKWYDEEAENNT